MKNQANTLKINSTDGYLHLEDFHIIVYSIKLLLVVVVLLLPLLTVKTML